jgi:hypothetical protein
MFLLDFLPTSTAKSRAARCYRAEYVGGLEMPPDRWTATRGGVFVPAVAAPTGCSQPAGPSGGEDEMLGDQS